MQVKRIVADIGVSDPAAARSFYQDILGLDILMDMRWIATYGSRELMPLQVSFMTEEAERADARPLIEVDDLDEVLTE